MANSVRTGVADYYAILGVSDHLAYQHTQKQTDNHTTEEEERFLREIVDVRIVMKEGEWSTKEESQVLETATEIETVSVKSQPLASASFGKASDMASDESWTVVEKTIAAGAPGFGLSNDDDVDVQLWNKDASWNANLDVHFGFRDEIWSLQMKGEEAVLARKGLRRKVETKLKRFQRQLHPSRKQEKTRSFYLALQRRKRLDNETLGLADMQLVYVRLHRTIIATPEKQATSPRYLGLAGQLLKGYQSQQDIQGKVSTESQEQLVALEDFLQLPEGFEEWSIPEMFQWIRDPTQPLDRNTSRTMLFSNATSNDDTDSVGCVEAVDSTSSTVNPDLLLPKLMLGRDTLDDLRFAYVPIVMIRRQRVDDKERYHEDAAITDIAVTFTSRDGQPVYANDDEDEENESFSLVGKTPWKSCSPIHPNILQQQMSTDAFRNVFALPVLIVRKNLPFGFCDTAFCTRVIGRFPSKNYEGLPLPEEELPMFCYPTGCRLFRTQYSNAPLPQYYGFVVKNERGDSIYVSCVSFMEPLSSSKIDQLCEMSAQRQTSSLPHRRFHEKQTKRTEQRAAELSSEESKATKHNGNLLLTAFQDMTTFENKTICLVSRFPFWSGFRKFLSHLHVISRSISDLPLERYISHLLLTVPLPKNGGPDVLVPLPALNQTMVLSMPPEKDLPLLDLPFHRLFACLDIRTIVSIVLGLLTLERKVILLSTRPSLVLDVCELLRALLFPFELCAPYVPRLTEPFKSSLGFPGALFVGIHDDGEPDGLATMVKHTYPEDSFIVDLDTGGVDCDGDRYEAINSVWNLIPESPRSILVSELETLCRDAKIVDGQEPLDSLIDSAFYVDLPNAVEGFNESAQMRDPLDDRAVRDAFLRFFCSILGGYERFLVVPDADFLVSGNEWFDSQSFLAAVPTGNAAFLTSLVSTQLFQSFIQRRTEASDVHCLLFDECLAEFHASPIPYGRLGGDVEVVTSQGCPEPRMLYSLLVDQSAALHAGTFDSIAGNMSMDASEADSSFSLNLSRASISNTESSIRQTESVANGGGDHFTAPSRQGLQPGGKFMYAVDGNPIFPYLLREELLLPKEPTSWKIEMKKSPDPLLARSERELEEANRRKRIATSNPGRKQRRCLWQLPKLIGSHFLGSWLLCVPALVSQDDLSIEQQSRFLLRALGALRHLRSKQRIVPDEAAYRALIIACGRTRTDRRVELVKVFGLLRSDGIFPSAVTLGQYTKALAEGYSKRSTASAHGECHSVEVTKSGFDRQFCKDITLLLYQLDTSLSALESQGKRWRNKYNSEHNELVPEASNEIPPDGAKKRGTSKPWLPVTFSSSFLSKRSNEASFDSEASVQLFAIWSKTCCCPSCHYIPLEEEIQAGWDVAIDEKDVPHAVACPRCTAQILPQLGIRELSIEQALETEASPQSSKNGAENAHILPPPIRPIIDHPPTQDGVVFVQYISPVILRSSLEQYIEEHGEKILERNCLRQLDPEVFFNFWWYCARFSLPLPLPTTDSHVNACAFVAWDRCSAERGCFSAAKVLSSFLCPDDLGSTSDDVTQNEFFDEIPLLSRFNLQGFYSTVWDHPNLSRILVTLVEACDKRDFRPVVECALQNDCELDAYRTILYLAKYQCTTAFHTFFPATLKPCKGYHFWCAIGTPLPIFDRLIRDSVRRIKTKKDQSALALIPDVSDVALGFRCVFGHII